MDCSVVMPSGKTARLRNLDSTWTVSDLVSELVARGHLDEGHVNRLGQSGLDFNGPIPATLDLRITGQQGTRPNESANGNADAGLRRRSLGTRASSSEAEPNLVQRPPARSSGLKKRTASDGSGLKKRPSTPKPTPVPKPAPKPIPQAPVPTPNILRAKSYVFDLKCSTNGSVWHSNLTSTDTPRKSKPVKPKPAPTSSHGTIHLVLDDSVSMGGEPLRQQAKGAKSFLDSRPPKDTIHLTVLDGNLSQYGTPADAKRAVDRVGATGGTPIKTRFSRLLNEVSGGKSGGDIVVFFTDGGSTDGDPIPAATALKKRGVRIICIGCGSCDERVLRAMASSPSDYHHAQGVGQILQAFQQVARSLGQAASSHTVKQTGRSAGATVATQVSSGAGNAPTSTGTYGGGAKALAANEGFDIIHDFTCHFCRSNERTACPLCGQSQCMGAGSPSGSPNEVSMTCCACRESFLVTLSAEAFQSVVSGGGKKK